MTNEPTLDEQIVWLTTLSSGRYHKSPEIVAAISSLCRLAECEQDAKRYRWLRENNIARIGPGIYEDDDCNTWLVEEKADAAIDSAMSVEQESK